MDILEKIFPHLQNWEKTREGKFTLKNIKEETKFFGFPQFKFKAIHIAGSKGKGTVANLISLILKNAGFRVGTFTSPHIFRVEERIQYNCKSITKNDLIYYCELIKNTIRNYKNETELTYFEILTLISFLYFKDKKVNYGIYEVGIGGMLDATNILETHFQIITSIEYEHTDILGYTSEKIFLQKAGIGKSQSPMLILDVSKDLLSLLEIYKERKNDKVFIYGRDFYIQNYRDILYYSGLYGLYKLKFKSNVSKKNEILVAAAIFSVEYIIGKRINPVFIEEAIKSVGNLYRLKIVSEEPLIIIDVAHTRQSIRNLVDSIKDRYPNKKFYILFSAMRNKDVVGMLFSLKEISHKFIFCSNGAKNSYTAEELCNLNYTYINGECEYFTQITEAMENIEKYNLYPLIVCGSFYNVSAVVRFLTQHNILSK